MNKKLHCLFKYVIKYTRYKKIIKCDDDVFLSKHTLLACLKYFNDKDFFGYYHDYPTNDVWTTLKLLPYKGPFYEGGIYFISRKAILFYLKNCTQKMLDLNQPEDKCLADVLRKKFKIVTSSV